MPSKILDSATVSIGAVRDSWARALDAANKSPKTILSYIAAVDALAAFLEASGMPTGIDAVRREHLEAFISARMRQVTHRGRPRSVNSVLVEYRSLRVFWNYAVDADEISRSPMAKMSPPRPGEKVIPVITDAEILAILRACARGPKFEARRDTAILQLFLDTGIRRQEAAGLTLSDVQFDQKVVRVTGKGNRQRDVPFGDATAVALDKYLRLRAGHRSAALPNLWLGMAGPMTNSGVYQVVRDRAAMAGVQLHPHQLRHTFAHKYLTSGGNEGDLMRLAGWQSETMLRRYGASAADHRARAAYQGRSPVDQILRDRR